MAKLVSGGGPGQPNTLGAVIRSMQGRMDAIAAWAEPTQATLNTIGANIAQLSQHVGVLSVLLQEQMGKPKYDREYKRIFDKLYGSNADATRIQMLESRLADLGSKIERMMAGLETGLNEDMPPIANINEMDDSEDEEDEEGE